jgi:hypothetical protein
MEKSANERERVIAMKAVNAQENCAHSRYKEIKLQG